jgi:hypothetical protein
MTPTSKGSPKVRLKGQSVVGSKTLLPDFLYSENLIRQNLVMNVDVFAMVAFCNLLWLPF